MLVSSIRETTEAWCMEFSSFPTHMHIKKGLKALQLLLYQFKSLAARFPSELKWLNFHVCVFFFNSSCVQESLKLAGKHHPEHSEALTN